MRFFSLLIGIRLPVLCKLISRNGISLRPAFLPRLFILLVNSLLSSFFTVVESIKYSRHIRYTPIEPQPVFIIGHWRTGSTWLHQLMDLDPRLSAPTTIQTVIPDHFIISARYYAPLMKLCSTIGRPMDNIRVMPSDPQEDEFALIRMGSESPLEKLFFPQEKQYFLHGYKNYIPEGKNLEKWKTNLLMFYRKIYFYTGQQIVSKNPFHTLRIPLLAEMFPDARFIHICRSPFDVIPSTVKMWNCIAESNRMKDGWKEPDTAEVASVYRFFLDYVAQERKKLGRKRFAEIRFEDLEKDPVKELRRVYEDLSLCWSEDFEQNIGKFLASTRNYKKNTYHLKEEERNTIRDYFEAATTW